MVSTWRLHHLERVRIESKSATACGVLKTQGFRREVSIGLFDILRISVSSPHLEGTLRRFSELNFNALTVELVGGYLTIPLTTPSHTS